MKSGRTHTIVVGASMAGMPAARVLADVFQRVAELKRDTLPNGPDLRVGVLMSCDPPPTVSPFESDPCKCREC